MPEQDVERLERAVVQLCDALDRALCPNPGWEPFSKELAEIRALLKGGNGG